MKKFIAVFALAVGMGMLSSCAVAAGPLVEEFGAAFGEGVRQGSAGEAPSSSTPEEKNSPPGQEEDAPSPPAKPSLPEGPGEPEKPSPPDKPALPDEPGYLEKAPTQVIGDERLGYLLIPEDWVRFYDLSGSSALQYTNGAHIITLDILFSPDPLHPDTTLSLDEAALFVQESLTALGVYDVAIDIVEDSFLGYPCKGCTGWYMEKDDLTACMINCFLLQEEDSTIHLLSLEGPIEQGEQVASILDSYTLQRPE